MTSNKQKLFIWARKRNISNESVYNVLKVFSLPPTYSESSKYWRHPYVGPNGETYYELCKHDMRKREITLKELRLVQNFLS